MKRIFAMLGMAMVASVCAQDLKTELNKVCQDTGMIGLSVVAMCKGEITDVFHYGQRDIARNLPVDNSTIFRVASISKHIGTIGLMQLYEKGFFLLDDDI